MNNNIIVALIVGISILGAGFLCSTKDTVFSSTQAPFGTIQVSGEGDATAIPDTTILNAGAQINAVASQEIAYSEMNKTINTIGSILEKAGIDKKNIQTANLSVNQNFDYTDGKQTANGYNAYQTLTIRIEQKEESVANEILDAISQIPNIQIWDVSFETKDTDAVYSIARIKALEDARKKADEIAVATGVKIKKVLSVTEGATQNYPTPMYSKSLSLEAYDDASSSASLNAGELEYSVSVNVSYEIQ